MDIRDFLAAEMLTTSGGQRSDTIFNMKMNEFFATQKIEGKRVVMVAKHKTMKTYGAAAVPMTEDLWQRVHSFIKFLRPVLIWREKKGEKSPPNMTSEEKMKWMIERPVEMDGTDVIFVTANNKPVGRYVINSFKSFHAHCMRIAVSTTVHEDKELSVIAARAMNHSANTSKRYQRNSAENALKIASFLEKKVSGT